MTVNVCLYCGAVPKLRVIYDRRPFLNVKYMHERQKGYKLFCPKCFLSSYLVEPTISSAVFAWQICVTGLIDLREDCINELCEVDFFG